MKVIDPMVDCTGIWQGDTPGTIRKRFECLGSENSSDFCANVTVYMPGEGSIFHNHPNSEELGYVICGSGMIQDMDHNAQAPLRQGNMFLVERGEIHRLFNDGRDPLIALMVCIAHTPMPEG